MRIAVTYEKGQILQHFESTEQFKIYDIAEDTIVSAKVISTNGIGHGALVGMLSALKVDALICGGIANDAKASLAVAGIRLYGGVSGNADAVIDAVLSGDLTIDQNIWRDCQKYYSDCQCCTDDKQGCKEMGDHINERNANLFSQL